MRAAILTIGTELTDGRLVDTNTSFIASRLEALGLRVALALTVPDDDAAISMDATNTTHMEAIFLQVSGSA